MCTPYDAINNAHNDHQKSWRQRVQERDLTPYERNVRLSSVKGAHIFGASFSSITSATTTNTIATEAAIKELAQEEDLLANWLRRSLSSEDVKPDIAQATTVESPATSYRECLKTIDEFERQRKLRSTTSCAHVRNAVGDPAHSQGTIVPLAPLASPPATSSQDVANSAAPMEM
ncbi:hypothetical protein BMF94_0988 [Rhodotorula taiwanensis]|uniref:Uncharacterized protein n=1 Tax=Rhodotorula taiwanensis TaxID=741276 RepID=A0A2S5BGL6_9BASI|nr:hypothetical protein BMF94_0988 [Rhodotorula taiwanensis]